MAVFMNQMIQKHVQITFHIPLSRCVYTKMVSFVLVGQTVESSYLIKF